MNELIGPELPPGEGAVGEAGAEPGRCCATGYLGRYCNRPARSVVDGRPYCGLHDRSGGLGRSARVGIMRDACAGVPTPTLDRLARSGGLAAILDAIGELRAAYLVDDMAEGLPALLAAGRRLVELAGYETGQEETDA